MAKIDGKEGQMKSETTPQKLDVTRIADGVMKIKLSQGKGFFKIGVGKKHGEANSLFLEIGGSRKFEIGNDCDTCHFWFKCLSEPHTLGQKKVVNLPKTISLPRPLDAAMIDELSPILEMLDKGEY